MAQILIGLSGGILLGFRWKFAVLYPATLLAAVFMIATGGLSWANAGLIILVIAAVQAGYVGGVAMRERGGLASSEERWKFGLHRH
jgi:hypothetical protein